MAPSETRSFSEILNSSTPTLVDFYTEWCGPCNTMRPILDDLKAQIGSQAMILKVDIEKNPKVAAKYRIQSVPTLAIFKNGELVWRQSGVVPASTLHSLLQQHISL